MRCIFQDAGHEVVGVDTSPLALEVCKQRGLREVHHIPISRLTTAKLGRFDTILMLGNNFGLFANKNNARRLLRGFLKITNPGAGTFPRKQEALMSLRSTLRAACSSLSERARHR